MADELLPCPFCGKPPKTEQHTDKNGEWESVYCDTEYCVRPETYGLRVPLAREQWNRRAEKTGKVFTEIMQG